MGCASLKALRPEEWMPALAKAMKQGGPVGALYTTLRNFGVDVMDYMRRYPDVRASQLDPLLHFVMYGLAEGRYMSPLPGGKIKLDYDDFTRKPLYFDSLVSLGKDCRTAQYLKTFNLRYFSSPFDWMSGYNLIAIVELLKNNLKNFFTDYQVLGNTKSYYKVVDARTGMLALHHFPVNRNVDEHMPFFQKMMRVKFDNLVQQIKKSNVLGFVFHGRPNEEINIFREFINDFADKRCYLLHILDSDQRYAEFDPVNLTFTFRFSDVHPCGNDHPDFRLGNVDMWQLIVRNIHLR